MRKLFLIFSIFLIGAVVASVVAWSNRASLTAHFISRSLGVPTSLNSLEISKTDAHLSQLWIGNPPKSKTQTSFSAESIDIASTFDQITGDPLILDEIRIENIFVGIEYYDARGEATNWSYILKTDDKKKKTSKDYLIRTLVLENLTVEVTQANGKVKRYPTIARMEFHNISSETGFPVQEIEKAIFNLMMQDLFRKLNLNDLLKSIPNSPLKYLPSLF